MVNTPKSIAFLYTCNEQFKTIIYNMKYLGKDLTKYEKDLYEEEYKTDEKVKKKIQVTEKIFHDHKQEDNTFNISVKI